MQRAAKYIDKAREFAWISAIISDTYLNNIYEEYGKRAGYVSCIGDVIVPTTEAFYEAFQIQIENQKEDWINVFEINGVDCFNDLIVLWSRNYIVQKFGLKI